MIVFSFKQFIKVIIFDKPDEKSMDLRIFIENLQDDGDDDNDYYEDENLILDEFSKDILFLHCELLMADLGFLHFCISAFHRR
jgi:hypothetical protein